MPVVQNKHFQDIPFSGYSSNSEANAEAFASELLENLEKMFTLY